MAPSPRCSGTAGVTATQPWRAPRAAPMLRRLPMVLDSGSRFLVSKRDLAQARIAPDADAPAARLLQEGEARLAIHRFAFSAANAPHGWQFFPCEDEAWGCIPVWGFATVSESRCAGVGVGLRVYGWLPMGTHRVVLPVRVDRHGFVDSALPASHAQYSYCEADPLYDAAHEAQQALLRSPFVAGFGIDAFLAEAAFFGAERVVLSSAGSKAAYSAAFCLARRAGRPRIVGLSAPANAAFARSLACWDEVVPYDELQTMSRQERTAYVDLGGSAALHDRVHAHLGATLAHSVAVGSLARQGTEDSLQRFGAAWKAFVERVDDTRAPWLRVREARGAAAVETAYRALRAGEGDPREGWMLAL